MKKTPPEEVLNAPAEGRLLKCLHEAVMIPEGVWRAYNNPASESYPLAQRRGEWVWITIPNGQFEKLPITIISQRCTCPA